MPLPPPRRADDPPPPAAGAIGRRRALARTVGWAALGAGSVLLGAGGCCRRVERGRTARRRAVLDGRAADQRRGGPPAGAPGAPPLPRVEPLVAVRIGPLRAAPDAIRIEASSGALRLRPGGELLRGSVEIRGDAQPGRGWTLAASRRAGRAIELELASAGRATGGGGPDGGPSLVCANGADVVVDGTPYPGAIRLEVLGRDERDEGPPRLAVVNDLPLDRYLPGVLAGELYHHWHPETFAAQAVAARSFAAAEAAWNRTSGGARRRPWDLVDTTRSQVYRGATVPPRAEEAARRTAGLVLAWEGRLVQGFYSACCGGAAARASDVIGPHPANAIPPLRGRTLEDPCCAGAPRYAWTIERPTRAAEASIRAWSRARRLVAYADLEGLTAVRVIRRNEHGRAVEHLLEVDEARSIPIDAEALRAALATDAGPRERPHSGWIESGTLPGGVGSGGGGGGGDITISGRGHGHGAGLCQFGAQSMATRGMPLEDILAAYYPGAELATAWRSAPATQA